jgi:hypothetical protein
MPNFISQHNIFQYGCECQKVVGFLSSIIFLELFPAICFNLLLKNLFLLAFAGASFGRSANTAKNSLSSQKDFHSCLG